MSISIHDTAAAFARYRDIVPDWTAFVEALARPLPATIWTNPDRILRHELVALLRGEGIVPRALAWHPAALRFPLGVRPGRHWGLLAGLFQVQEEAAMLPVVLLDPQPGHRVLDLCAAPGNKTAQIALALGGRGTVMANDVDSGRLAGLRQTVKRLALINVTATSGPAQTFPGPAGIWDRVLADVPCSGEGTWRKADPRGARLMSAPSDDLVERQFRILRRAFELCRVGGRVVYATCTFAPEENEAVVERLLRQFGTAVRLLPVGVPGFATMPGLDRWNGRSFHPEMVNSVRVWPHVEDTGGFFLAVIEKRDGEPPVDVPEAPSVAHEPALLHDLRERFGVGEVGLAAPVRGVPGKRYLSLVSDDHTPVAHPRHQFTGLPAVGVQMRPPKPTTALGMALTGWATRNVVDVDAEGARRFLGCEAVRLGDSLADVSPGYVLVRFRGYGLGVGRVGLPRHEGVVVMDSLYPKAWRTAARGGLGEGAVGGRAGALAAGRRAVQSVARNTPDSGGAR